MSALPQPHRQPVAGRRPRIAVIGTGGTFAMHARHAFDWVEYSESGVIHSIDVMLATMRELGLNIDIVPIPFRALGSTGITPDDWLELAALVRATVAADATLDGIVITHGTATLEETAWFLHLAAVVPQPVVITGAQRPKNTHGSDVDANLRGALAVAASPDARGLGALVVMDGMIYAARDVTKAASFELHAFEAQPYGALGRIDPDGTVVVRRRPYPGAPGSAGAASRPAFTVTGPLPRVDLTISYAGADGTAIDALVAAGARGLVVVGLAPGRPANGERAALLRAVASGVVVVQSSRAARGIVPVQAFLERDGIYAAGDLAPHKVRILLQLLLASGAGDDRQQLQQSLLAY